MAETQVGGARIARILLVEDDSDDVEITRRAFDRAKIGNELAVVDNGQAALDFLYKNCSEHDDPGADLVLLDLEMPKLDGRAVLREIWSDRRLRHIPVIILTASEREEDLIQSYKGGAIAFLRKPVSMERLLNAVGDLHDYRVYIVRLSK